MDQIQTPISKEFVWHASAYNETVTFFSSIFKYLPTYYKPFLYLQQDVLAF